MHEQELNFTNVMNSLELPCEARKTAPFYFCNSFVKNSGITIFLAHIYSNKFPITHIFHTHYTIRDGDHLKF